MIKPNIKTARDSDSFFQLDNVFRPLSDSILAIEQLTISWGRAPGSFTSKPETPTAQFKVRYREGSTEPFEELAVGRAIKISLYNPWVPYVIFAGVVTEVSVEQPRIQRDSCVLSVKCIEHFWTHSRPVFPDGAIKKINELYWRKGQFVPFTWDRGIKLEEFYTFEDLLSNNQLEAFTISKKPRLTWNKLAPTGQVSGPDIVNFGIGQIEPTTFKSLSDFIDAVCESMNLLWWPSWDHENNCPRIQFDNPLFRSSSDPLFIRAENITLPIPLSHSYQQKIGTIKVSFKKVRSLAEPIEYEYLEPIYSPTKTVFSSLSNPAGYYPHLEINLPPYRSNFDITGWYQYAHVALMNIKKQQMISKGMQIIDKDLSATDLIGLVGYNHNARPVKVMGNPVRSSLNPYHFLTTGYIEAGTATYIPSSLKDQPGKWDISLDISWSDDSRNDTGFIGSSNDPRIFEDSSFTFTSTKAQKTFREF